MKLDRGKQMKKLMNKLDNNTDSYLGRGKDGLDDGDIIMKESNEENLLGLENNNNGKLGCFSQGYLDNLQNEAVTNSNMKNPEKPGLTPNKIIHNKITTALKTSLKKNVHLDTELKRLSKEFRYLLTNQKSKLDSVEKKLDFTEPKKLNPNKQQQEDKSEFLTEQEMKKLEDDILLKVLEENFGFKEFLPGQLQCIKNLLNWKNTLVVVPPAGGKSLLYQLPALVFDGLTIVICPYLTLITEQLSALPSCLSGASLSSFTKQTQRNEIFEAIREKKINVLFITPERLALENLSELDEISMICFEDATSACQYAQNFRSSYVAVGNIIKKLKPNVLLFLTNYITPIIEKELISEYNITDQVKENISLPKNIKLTINKEDQKLTALVKMLRSQQFKNLGSTIIFCNFKKTVDKVTSFLNQNGLSASSYHSGKQDSERQLIQQNFMNDKIRMVVSTVAFSKGISKQDIRLIILFEMPPSIEHFLQQVGRAGRDKKESYVHIFLNDDDFFVQRNQIYMEKLDKTNIVKFIEYLFSQASITRTSIKRTHVEIDDQPSTIKNMIFDLPKTISVNFTTSQDFSGIKKQMQIFLLLSLINTNLDESFKMNCLGVGPSIINIRFYKQQPEVLAKEEPNIKFILENSKEYSGAFRFSTIEVCERIGITHVDLVNYLYHLQSKGEIGYESKEEGVFLVLERIPEGIKDLLQYLHERNEFLININLKKVITY
jgi:ATP-dependent DNA helicase Q4